MFRMNKVEHNRDSVEDIPKKLMVLNAPVVPIEILDDFDGVDCLQESFTVDSASVKAASRNDLACSRQLKRF